MAEQAVDHDLDVKRLEQRLQALERRLEALERQSAVPVAVSTELPPGGTPEHPKRREPSISAIPVLGKALLAIAGAYLLRAIAESGTLPKLPLLLLAVVYSGALLVWAARTHNRSYFTSTVFALTASAILAPVLWEGTVRFQEFSTGFASCLLVGYVSLSLALSRREVLEAIPWIATLTAVAIDFALLIATHELSVLIVALLVIALVAESASLIVHSEAIRAVPALAADSAIAISGLVMTSPGGVPDGYRPISAFKISALCLALLLIYGGSLTVRGFVLRRRWTMAEVGQAAVASVLGTWVSLRTTQGGASIVLGTLFLASAMGCYWGVLKHFADAEMQRNRRVSANYAAVLVLAAMFLLSAGELRILLLCAGAVALTLAFVRTGHFSFAIHAVLYLLVTCFEGGLFDYAARTLAGLVPTWPHWPVEAATITALLCYLIGSRSAEQRWQVRVIWIIPSAIVALALTALAITGLTQVLPAELSASRLSMVRTVLTSATALGLAYAGSRWNRLELGWVAYVAIALGALKLLIEDLRFGNAGTLMVSLLIYGLILILLPRVTQFGRVEL